MLDVQPFVGGFILTQSLNPLGNAAPGPTVSVAFFMDERFVAARLLFGLQP